MKSAILLVAVALTAAVTAALFSACSSDADIEVGNAAVMARYVEVGGALDGTSDRSAGPFDEVFWARCVTDESATCLPVLIVETINGNVFDIPVTRECFDATRPGVPWPPSSALSPCND